jgi:hypothetical protein
VHVEASTLSSLDVTAASDALSPPASAAEAEDADASTAADRS